MRHRSDAGAARARITIRDVAREADVHVSTVSRSLDPDRMSLVNDRTRERVRTVAERLGYTPDVTARGLRRGQTKTIGVVVPNLSNPIYAPFTRGLAHAVDREGFLPFVADTEDDEARVARILQHFFDRRADAIVTTAVRAGHAARFIELANRGVPVVTAVRTIDSSRLARVDHDDAEGGRLVAEHLLGLGHVRLARLRGPNAVQMFGRRSRGFATTVRAGGGTLVADVPPAEPRATVEEGVRMANAVLTRTSRPTALFAQNDELAIGALQAVHELGLRCPEDVSIVGYNDVPFAANTQPPLTTIRLDTYAVGQRAGELALALIHDRDADAGGYRVDPELVVRGSTGPPPAP